MDMNRMVDTIKRHPDFAKIGMIASHLGIVRGTSLTGGEVKGIEVSFDQNKVDGIVNEMKQLPGIIEILVETYGGRLKVGDEIMAVFVAGDIRDHVFPVLVDTVNRIKGEGTTRKKELF